MIRTNQSHWDFSAEWCAPHRYGHAILSINRNFSRDSHPLSECPPAQPHALDNKVFDSYHDHQYWGHEMTSKHQLERGAPTQSSKLYSPNHDFVKAALTLQRRYRITQTLSSACSRRRETRERNWRAVTDGRIYSMEFGDLSSGSYDKYTFEVLKTSRANYFVGLQLRFLTNWQGRL